MTEIRGHDAAIAEFQGAMRGERPPHAWLFSGVQGIGKASLAKAAARRLLAEAAGPAPVGDRFSVQDDHPTAALFNARSHPDYRLVEREIWEKNHKERVVPYNERKGDEVPARSIRVIQIRWLDQIFALAPSMSNRRIVVIDAADEMELSASNALLKRLEEPPPFTTFILITHSSGRLLPTIRSRCRMLRFSGLSGDIMTSVLRAKLPDAAPSEIAVLNDLGQGSPGRALRLAGIDVGGMTAALMRIAASGDPDNRERAVLAQSMSSKAGQVRFEAFLGLVPAFLASEAKARQGAALGAALKQWEAAQDLASSAVPSSLDVQAVSFALASHVAALAPTR